LTWLKKISSNGDNYPLRLLGLDPGEKRIGVAISDPLAVTAQGLETIAYDHPAAALKRIKEICLAYAVSEIVVGNPLKMSGEKGSASMMAEDFAATLRAETCLPVVMVDERLTSKGVEKMLIEGNTRRSKRRKVRDKLAAVLILETYLAQRKDSSS
jgi:putative holliday junction resolvase